MSVEDPERARFEALLAAQRRGEVSEAEREELALYTAADPNRAVEAADNERVAKLGEGWLARVEKDRALAEVDGSRRARIERGTGLALIGVGWLLNIPFGLLGVVLMGIGALTVLYSLVRVRLAAGAEDPYKDVVR